MNVKRICVEKDQQISDDGDKDQNIVINSLDYDSLAKIIMLLPIPERIDVEKVCTKWKEACRLAWYDIKKYKCESSIGRCYDNRLLTQSYVKEILLRCGNYLKELSLSDVCNSSIMPFVGDHCKNLTTLECKFGDNVLTDNADHFVQAFRQLDKLKCIKIINCSSKTIILSAIIDSLPEEINEIHLFSKPRWFNELNSSILSVKKFKNLQKLTVHDLKLNNIKILQEISEKITLVYLDIKLNDFPGSFFFLFEKLVNLEYIKMKIKKKAYEYGNRKELFTKVLNTIFCTCKNLKHLDIPCGPYDLAEIPLGKWMNFQNLEYLGIFCNVTPDLANTIVKYCKNLKRLSIHNCSYIINNSALQKLTELKNLECLLLLDTFRIHDKSITAIANNCKNLIRLEIPNCITVLSTDSGPLSVLDELSKLQCLKHLNLSHSKNLQDSTIIAIANHCKNLKSLDIQNCTGLTETALVALLNLKNLQKLDVSYLDIITESFLIKLKGLKELHCNGCKKLTDVGIIQVIKNNPDLEILQVYYNYNITIDMIIAAADQATENRTSGIILHIYLDSGLIFQAPKSMIKSQWLVVTC